MSRMISTVPITWYDDVLKGWKGRLGTSGCPGSYRGIDRDLQSLVSEGVEIVFCLLQDIDFRSLGVPGLLAAYEARGLEVRRLAIPDYGVPPQDEMDRLVGALGSSLRTGQRALVHCAAGIGRTGTVVACFLVRVLGLPPLRAIQTVRAHRPGSLENWDQENFVHDYACAMNNS